MKQVKYIIAGQKGVTLVELLLSLSILSIILLTVTNFFYQAGTNNLSNQNKTVALNVARNTMIFLEKQNFIEMREKFEPVMNGSEPADTYYYDIFVCNDQYTLIKHANPLAVPAGCRYVKINNEDYQVAAFSEQVPEEEQKKYYIPVKVMVKWGDDYDKESVLDGTIKSEDLR